MDAAAKPLPSEERTPPVTKINFVFINTPQNRQSNINKVKYQANIPDKSGAF
jgi:hypothetical protein